MLVCIQAGCSDAIPAKGSAGTPVAALPPGVDTAQTHPTGTNTDPASPLGHTGTPAQSPEDQPLPDTTEILSMRDTTMQEGPACRIDFAYTGYERESVFWMEPCADVTAKFMDRAQLEQLNRWERIDDYGRNAIAKRTGGQVLYVGGTFAASVYPVDYNYHTIEISIAD